MIIKAGVLGVSGYTGRELVRLLAHHPNINIKFLFSTSLSGQYKDSKNSFLSLPDVTAYNKDKCSELDVIFLAVPHTKAMPIVDELMSLNGDLKIIDLSADFRLNDATDFESNYKVTHTAVSHLKDAVYGLPEKYKEAIANTRLCANPGCYATSMILGLLPLSDHLNSNEPIVIDSKSGVSGAGKSLKESSLFCEVHDTFSAYSTGVHRHTAELVQETGFINTLFSPHLIPIDRGIESAIYISTNKFNEDDLFELYSTHYKSHPFVTVLPSNTLPNLSLVQRTNHCVIIPKVIGSWVVIFSLIDNLMKGASGQAIQNANIMFGFDETAGLLN